MPEPTSSASAAAGAAGAAAWKAAGGLAGVAAGGAGLAAIVVMLMTQPRNPAEWATALISTVVASVAGGAWALHHLGLSELASTGPVGLAMLFGLAFACGLPGWVLVRAAFTWAHKRRDRDIAQLADEVRQQLKRRP